MAPDAARAAGISMVTCYQNVGGLISTWTYLPTAAPQYTAGNSVNLAIGVCITLLFGITLLYQRHENRIRDSGGRDHRLEGKTESEIAQLGHLHPRCVYFPPLLLSILAELLWLLASVTAIRSQGLFDAHELLWHCCM